MAIIKSLESRVGINVNYHRIIGMNFNFRDKKIVICLASYLDKIKRTNGFNPLEVVDIEVPEKDFNLFTDENAIALAYLWLKENVVGFDESIDDLEKVEAIIHESEQTSI